MSVTLQMPPEPVHDRSKIYLIGGGIASMAAAAFMIRDGDILGPDITILEALDAIGGSLDAAGSSDTGYVLRGGRMFESKYLCTFDLFASIPTLDDSKSVTQEIVDWNNTIETSSKSRLFEDGHRHTAPEFGLSERHILTIERLALEPERLLNGTSIEDQFDASFFKTNFWLMWCTTFAFQPWHSAIEFKRYLVRFAHMVDGFNRLHGIMRTVYNQYDSLVRPLKKWLDQRGVVFQTGTIVTGLSHSDHDGRKAVTLITCETKGKASQLEVGPNDYVLLTLGSMTDGSSLGGMDEVPNLKGNDAATAWKLWEQLAVSRPEFGRPAVFANHIDQSKWISFTVTLHKLTLLDLIRDATGNVPGEGGLITFPKSNWLASIVIPYQPHFIGQPENVAVFWGYALTVDAPGNFVHKPMSACTGREILTEILGHLDLRAQSQDILRSANCIPCMMPFITSQFLKRQTGDRPDIFPEGWRNLALIGQFVEMPDDVVFTVEYSIRAAQTAAYELLGLKRKPPPVYKGVFDPRVLYRSFMALHDLEV